MQSGGRNNAFCFTKRLHISCLNSCLHLYEFSALVFLVDLEHLKSGKCFFSDSTGFFPSPCIYICMFFCCFLVSCHLFLCAVFFFFHCRPAVGPAVSTVRHFPFISHLVFLVVLHLRCSSTLQMLVRKSNQDWFELHLFSTFFKTGNIFR